MRHVTSDAVARDAANAVSGTSTQGDRRSRRRARRIASRCVLALAGLCTLMGACLVLACAIDDWTIQSAPADAVAQVIDTSLTRTVVRFSSADGRIHIPLNGVLYSSGLQTGQFVRVEYDSHNPDLVRVAGRTAELALLPVGSTIAGVWVVLFPIAWLLRRQGRGEPHRERT
jgi:hypothetical protein